MLATQILATVEPQRFLKATEGLVNGAFHITVTRSDEDSIEGFVTNGDNVSKCGAWKQRRSMRCGVL